MGYRSTVVCALDKKIIMESAIANNLPELLQNANIIKKTDGAYYYTIYEIKWYDDFTDVAELSSFLGYLEEDGYGLLVLGEDGATVEESGNYWEYDLGVVSSISTPFGDM